MATRKRKLLPISEIRSYLQELSDFGIQIQSVDIRSDGITISALPSLTDVITSLSTISRKPDPDEAFDAWKAAQKN